MGGQSELAWSIMNEETDLYYAQLMKSLAARIRELRVDRGLTVTDMVRKHNYHDSQWRRIERDGASSVSSLLKIARALNTTLSVLLDGLGDFPSSEVRKVEEGWLQLEAEQSKLTKQTGDKASETPLKSVRSLKKPKGDR